MKKIVWIIFIFVLLCGCSKKQENNITEEKSVKTPKVAVYCIGEESDSAAVNIKYDFENQWDNLDITIKNEDGSSSKEGEPIEILLRYD